MDNKRGKELYKFDMSLMERLSITAFPMSRLDVQRRMRPEISSLIRCVDCLPSDNSGACFMNKNRNTLYPGLEDHDRVLQYKSVRGMERNVFFLSHGHKELGGGDDSVSKHNPYEVLLLLPYVPQY